MSAPSHPMTSASQMKVSLPVMMPSLRGNARAAAIVSTVLVVSNEASLRPMICGIVASRASVSGGKSGPNALGNWNAISGRPDAVGNGRVVSVDHLATAPDCRERSGTAERSRAPRHRRAFNSLPQRTAPRRRARDQSGDERHVAGNHLAVHTRSTSSCSSRFERRAFARVHVHRDGRRLAASAIQRDVASAGRPVDRIVGQHRQHRARRRCRAEGQWSHGACSLTNSCGAVAARRARGRCR